MQNFLRLIVVALLLNGSVPGAQAQENVSAQTLALHQRLLVLDSHLDTPIQLSRPGWNILQRHSTLGDGSQVDLPRMQEG